VRNEQRRIVDYENLSSLSLCGIGEVFGLEMPACDSDDLTSMLANYSKTPKRRVFSSDVLAKRAQITTQLRP